MLLGRLSTDGFRDAVQKIDTVILPIGSVEAHGRHCPLSTDVIIPERIARDVDERLADRLLVAPAIPYGYSKDLSYFPGTVHVSAEVMAAYVSEVALSWVKWGIKHVVLLNGHGGNIPALSIAADRIAESGVKVVLINWWLHFSKEILEICEGQGHAGEDETSTVLALDASMVDMNKAGVYWPKLITTIKAPELARYSYPNAMSGDARLATAEKGEKIYAAVCARIVEILNDVWEDRLVR
ncbi:MAG: creatininase family protein [Bacillota bacterium]